MFVYCIWHYAVFCKGVCSGWTCMMETLLNILGGFELGELIRNNDDIKMLRIAERTYNFRWL